jgi:predicted amidohydrolase YtcJ
MSIEVLIFHNGKITANAANSEAEVGAISGGRVVSIGINGDVLKPRGRTTKVVDLAGRRAILGLNDSCRPPAPG